MVYIEEDGILLVIFAKAEGKGKMDLSKSFTYNPLRNVEYEDCDSTNLLLDVESSSGIRRVLVDEVNLVGECCSPKMLRKDTQMKHNLIVALHAYVIGELMVTNATTPPKESRKLNPKQ